MAKTARDIALSALMAFRKGGAWADGYLKDALKEAELSKRDASLASQITYGVLQNLSLLDFYIGKFSSIKMNKISPRIIDVLRVGIYQLIFLDRIPTHAIVNEAVKAARRDNPRAAGFVNAVLRKISGEKENLPEPVDMATKYSHPVWLVDRLKSVYSDETEDILKENNKIPPICARVNTLVTNTVSLIEELIKEGVNAEKHPWLEDCVTLSETGDISATNAFKEGKFHICDPASQMCARALGVVPENRVLDTCAAPGGKSFTIAQYLGGKGELVSCDIHKHKIKLLDSGAKRLHIKNVSATLSDGRNFREEWENSFDAVLCDVPCSGIGVIRKKPEIRFKKEEEIARLPEIQLEILKNASRYVKPGGCLVYSTCTILPEENGDVVNAFLIENDDFSREEMTLSCPNGTNKGEITLLPHKNECDGFFICKLRRAK